MPFDAPPLKGAPFEEAARRGASDALPRGVAPLGATPLGAPITPAAKMPNTEPATVDRPPGGGTDLSVPPGVTLLHDSFAQPPRAPLSLGDGVVDLTVDEDRPASATPAALRTGPDDVTTDDVTTEAAGARGVAEAVAEDPDGESSATAIADMLRHGGSKLFFKR